MLLVDADHYWRSSPMGWLNNQTGYDIIAENNNIPPKYSVCAGMVYLNSTVNTIRIWDTVYQQTKLFRFLSLFYKLDYKFICNHIE